MDKIDNADICELAHELTKLKCAEKKIVCDTVLDENTAYTHKAQAIFNDYHDLIEKHLIGNN